MQIADGTAFPAQGSAIGKAIECKQVWYVLARRPVRPQLHSSGYRALIL